MAIRKASAAKVAALVPINAIVADVASPEYSREAMIARLSAKDTSAKDRTLLLSALPMGEVAAIGGIAAGIGSSVNEVLNLKMMEKHGRDWAKVAKAIRSDLCDADKERRKDIDASLESIRETVSANCGGDKSKARDTIRRVKEWGLGIRQTKGAGANEKRSIRKHLMEWESLPSLYRRICNDENSGTDEMELAERIAAYFTARGVQPRAVLECKGASEWTPPAA